MNDLTALLSSVASILRDDPDLRALAPNWGAEDARAHVFVGPPPVGAANTGRSPFVVLDLAEVRQGPCLDGNRRDATTTATIALRLVARRRVADLARLVGCALATDDNRHLGDPDHVLGFTIERGAVERLGQTEAADLRLAVRLLGQPGAKENP